MERHFNISGPCIPTTHYMISALDRPPGIRLLIANEQYFVVHVRRQTGRIPMVKDLVLCDEKTLHAVEL